MINLNRERANLQSYMSHYIKYECDNFMRISISLGRLEFSDKRVLF